MSSEEGGFGPTLGRPPYLGNFCNQSEAERRTTKKKLARILLALYLQRNTWRKYGKLTVFCNEIFIMAPVKLWWWLSETFLILTTGLCVFQLYPQLWIVLMFASILALLQLLAFFKTCMRDPGILPRSDFITAFKNFLSVISSWEKGNGLAVTRVVTHSNGTSEQLTYCWRCHHFRAARTSHCGTCDCCMLQHDHHCPVYGGCVAKHNLASFHVMVGTMIGFWVYIVGYCIYSTTTSQDPFVIKSGNGSAYSVMRDPKILFYLVMAQIGTAVAFPPLIKFSMGVFCEKEPAPSLESQVDSALKEGKVKELLAFAIGSNLSSEEIDIIKQLYTQRGVEASVHQVKSQEDSNQNYHTESETT